jgi:MFS family permease
MDNQLARKNAYILAGAGALAGANTTVLFSTAAILGYNLAEDKTLSTLPVTVYVIGLALASLPIGYASRRFGRRATYMGATFFGVFAGLTAACATWIGSFSLLCLACVFGGIYASAVQSYRFAAADTASDDFKPKAISWVLAGGIIAGIIGPQLVIHTQKLTPATQFFSTYIGQAIVALLACLVLSMLFFPPLKASEQVKARPLSVIMRQPKFIVAVLCGIASYMTMNFVMTAAPLAMKLCGHSVEDGAWGLQWHVIGMFAPSFFTGNLIARYGATKVILFGFVLLAASAFLAMGGLTLFHFWGSLILLGVGWNFGYIGASALITQCHTPMERTQVQSANDFIIFTVMAIGSFSSGLILVKWGWNGVNMTIFPFLIVAGLGLLWLKFVTPAAALRS